MFDLVIETGVCFDKKKVAEYDWNKMKHIHIINDNRLLTALLIIYFKAPSFPTDGFHPFTDRGQNISF